MQESHEDIMVGKSLISGNNTWKYRDVYFVYNDRDQEFRFGADGRFYPYSDLHNKIFNEFKSKKTNAKTVQEIINIIDTLKPCI